MEVAELKKIVRVSSIEEEMELTALRDACLRDLERVGIRLTDSDPLVRQAIWLYVKAYFGYDADSEKFTKAYEALRDSMSLTAEYVL